MSHPASPARAARRIVLALAIGLSLSACATSSNPKDPFEKFNRSMFAFNDAIDQAALKPAATAYKRVLPSFVQTGVSNFFGNMADVWSGINNLLQGKGADGFSDITRVALNSTFGLAGILDIASEAGLRKHNEDFGQTLGHWGVNPGPHLMLPLLGPSTVRDTVALPLDFKADPWAYKEPIGWRNVGIAVRAVDQRAAVLDASNLMEEAALDRYEFVRDGFLQRRESRIDDGAGRKKKDDKAAKADDDSPPPPVFKPADSPAPAPAAAPAAPVTPVAKPVSSETGAKELTTEAVAAQ